MSYKKFLGAAFAAPMIVIAITLALAPAAWAQSNYKVLYSGGNACDYPYAGLIFDGAGNFYGTCLAGTGNGSGTVFEMSPNPDGSWTPTLLYSFTGCGYHPGPDGGCPTAAVIFDAAGNLYGTTLDGGLAGCQDDLGLGYGCGVVFKLTPNPGGGWTESLLHSFTGGADGSNPYASLILDASGNLYGTTTLGGAHGGGVIFKLTPNPDGSWAESVLLTGGRNSHYYGGLIFDALGNLYGTASGGGKSGFGEVFELTPNPDGSWKKHGIHEFKGASDGANPYASLVMDAVGNLYGTAANGGTDGSGVVFKLAPKPAGGWGFHVAHQFKGGKDGANPWAGVIFDAAGNLYGTTLQGGIVGCGNFFQYGCGTVFEVMPKPDGSWGEHVMYRFRGHERDGFPYAGLVFDTAGNLYGTASYWWGTVFEITP